MLLQGFPDLHLMTQDLIAEGDRGKVAEIRGTADRLGMLTQLGILPDVG